jgi:hypothetical protein
MRPRTALVVGMPGDWCAAEAVRDGDGGLTVQPSNAPVADLLFVRAPLAPVIFKRSDGA